jgi:hypothetical protein
MDSWTKFMTRAGHEVPAWQLVARGLWIALRLIAVFYLGEAGERFFYQGF